jgi:ubiquinone/menaquinone biosynthesis C-methylase UbiE
MSEQLDLSVVPWQPTDVDFAWYEEIRTELLRRTVGRARRVLDVGCGSGNVLFTLSEQIGQGIGIDVSEDDLERAEGERQRRDIKNLTFKHADALAIPFPDDSFDVVLLLGDVLSYVAPGKHPLAVAELFRVLEPGGRVVHDSMNWDWEYRWPYPASDVLFTRVDGGGFTAHRLKRTASGLETSQDDEVLPDTPLHRWLLQQTWPVCSSPEAGVWLPVKENAPLPEAWFKRRGEGRFQHYGARDLQQLYREAGFQRIECFAYGQTYDIVNKAGLLEQLGAFQSKLALAEAELAYTLRLGSGPWLFLTAEK